VFAVLWGGAGVTFTHFAMIVCGLLALVGLALYVDEWRQRRRDRSVFKINPLFRGKVGSDCK
jgi:FtsZ-interacting cell division protein ZipA